MKLGFELFYFVRLVSISAISSILMFFCYLVRFIAVFDEGDDMFFVF